MAFQVYKTALVSFNFFSLNVQFFSFYLTFFLHLASLFSLAYHTSYNNLQAGLLFLLGFHHKAKSELNKNKKRRFLAVEYFVRLHYNLNAKIIL